MNLKEEEQPIYLRIYHFIFPFKRKEKIKRSHFLERFLQNKHAVVGLFLFALLFGMTLILPEIYPIDVSKQEITQQNISPGRNMLSVPKALQCNVSQISVGSTFSVGVTSDGRLYQWGKRSEALKKIPKELHHVLNVCAGQNHILAINQDGKLIAWGLNRFGQADIPIELRELKNFRQIYAGYQYSIAISEFGEVYFWGNKNLVDYDDQNAHTNFIHVTGNANAILGLKEDGTVSYLGKKESSYRKIPKFRAKVVLLEMTSKEAFAVDAKGNVYRWGCDEKESILSKEELKTLRLRTLVAGRNHIVGITVRGNVVAFGDNTFHQCQIPKKVRKSEITQIFCGYNQNYAITKENKIIAWGLKGYVLGTDAYGRDLFVRLLHGGRITMMIGFVAVAIQTVIGVCIGTISGYFGGLVDDLLMRFTEVVNALPFLPFAMILSALIGEHLTQMQRILMIMIILGVLNWTGVARLVRAQVLAQKSCEYVTAAKAIGATRMQIVFSHILPNVIGYVIVSATGSFASAMLTESSLSFLGFGVIEPQPTWGNMLTDGKSMIVISMYWWRWLFPALALCLVTVSINFIGDGFKDVMEPKENT